MPKVVIGEGIHGYRLSKAALIALVEAPDCGHITRRKAERDEMAEGDDEWMSLHEGDVLEDGHEYGCGDAYVNLARDCPALVRIVTVMGPAAEGKHCGRLGVVDVPDGVDWYITTDDETGHEWVAERHRTWHLPGRAPQ